MGWGRAEERRIREGDFKTPDKTDDRTTRTPQTTHPHAHSGTRNRTPLEPSVQLRGQTPVQRSTPDQYSTPVERSILLRSPNPPAQSPGPSRVRESRESTPAGSEGRELERLHQRIMSPTMALREQAFASARVAAKIGREDVSYVRAYECMFVCV